MTDTAVQLVLKALEQEGIAHVYPAPRRDADRMRRREFILALGGAAAWPFAARAQQSGMRRIGVLMGTQANSRDGQLQVGALRERLQQLGWVDGRNVQFDYRWLEGQAGEARRLAKDLIALQPDVLVTHGTPISVAVLKETQAIPIVFV